MSQEREGEGSDSSFVKTKSQSLYSLLSSSRNTPVYSTGVPSIDVSLTGKKGIKEGGIYDLSCLPGNVGKWEILFSILSNYLALAPQPKKIMWIKASVSVPWFKLRNMQGYQDTFDANIDILNVDSLTQLIHILQSVDFTPYGMVVVDEFHGLYQQSLSNLQAKLHRRKEFKNHQDTTTDKNRSFMKRDINGTPTFSPKKKLNMVLQNLMLLVNSITENTKCIFITTGRMTTMTQRFYAKPTPKKSKLSSSPPLQGSSPSFANLEEEDEEEEEVQREKFVTQQILVPILSLNGPWASYYTNRIILYRDWVIEKPKGQFRIGLDQSFEFIDYIPLLEQGSMQPQPQFLVVGVLPNGDREFNEGWFKVVEENGRIRIVDVKPVEEELTQSDPKYKSLLEDTDADLEPDISLLSTKRLKTSTQSVLASSMGGESSEEPSMLIIT